jgi:hypothetical protein
MHTKYSDLEVKKQHRYHIISVTSMGAWKKPEFESNNSGSGKRKFLPYQPEKSEPIGIFLWKIF